MKYAILESGGKQYRAVEGGTIEVDRLPVEAGVNVKLEQVLLLADGETISVGTPLVKDIPVWTTVVEHFKGPKVIIFNYSPKKRIRVKTGHRQNYTRLLVEQIGGRELVKKEAVKAEKTEKTAKVETKAATTASVKVKKPAAKKTSGKVEPKKPATKAPAKTTAKTSPKEKKPAASSSKKTTPAKAELKKKTPASSPKGKKPAAK
jgi:large subunit ribosomal protein L21